MKSSDEGEVGRNRFIWESERQLAVIVWRFLRATQWVTEADAVYEANKAKNRTLYILAGLSSFIYLSIASFYSLTLLNLILLTVLWFGFYFIAIKRQTIVGRISDTGNENRALSIAEWAAFFDGDDALLQKFLVIDYEVTVSEILMSEQFVEVRKEIESKWDEINENS